MAKTKSRSTKNAAVKPVAALTAGEFLRYFDNVHSSVLGLAELVRAAASGGYPSDLAGFYPLESSMDRLFDITERLKERFKEAHGDIPYHLETATAEIAITAEDVDSYKEAIEPACAFISLANNHDFGSEDRITGFIGFAGILVDAIANEGVELLKSRLKEGGAR